MEETIDYNFVLHSLAEAQLDALYSLGSDSKEGLLSLIKRNLKRQPESFLAAIYSDFKLIKAHTSYLYPTESGMYLLLMHGRPTIEEAMDDWGSDGPWIGPLQFFNCTYLTDIGIGFKNGSQLTTTNASIDYPAPIYLRNGLLYYDGIYYGDWELQYVEAKKNPKKAPKR